ncbi:putative nucleotidyltransferase substrate binding domain-containing protein [Pseudonocardia sp. TRM90224]|uniref:putative nucleotidyltransferase substrate binding domain-containing protein n=1 Tax=Pseudonocardia sp. TRM90224 TaxID=2812678 RepID=UPI001E4C8FCB|nr:putative nucleotidyltransferase substrate binding domain-containing protein [Pseudonocardia sp. TRM90224]
MADEAEFLRAHPPFDGLEPAELAALAATATTEDHPAGASILVRGEGPPEHVRVVRSGSVEIVHSGRVLDLLGPGELFGHAAMLAGLPIGFTAVAHGPTTCLRLPAAAVRDLLGRPAGLRYVARSLLAPTLLAAARPDSGPDSGPDAAQRPVRELIRAPLCTVPAETSIREAAQRMTGCGATAVVVPLGDGPPGNGRLGILTDRDLRTVIADGTDTAAPVRLAMSAPAWTTAADRLGGEVLLDMLDRGVRHVPVLDATGRLLGVLEDADVVAATTRSSFGLRAAIARAATVPELVAAAQGLTATVIALHDAKVAASDIAGITSVVVDALTRRLIELVVAELGNPPRPLTWLALGSLARREAVPSSDVDSGLVWVGPADEDEAETYGRTLAERVLDGLAAAGFRADSNGAVASNRLFARSYEAWQAAARGWLTDPAQTKAPIFVSLMVDARPVWGLRVDPAVPDVFRNARRHPDLLRLLGKYALAHRPPTGFLRDFVVEHTGRRRGRLDLKSGGLVPIVDLARWAGMAAGVTSASTPARLRAAVAAGTLDAGAAATLEEAFHLVLQLRLAHQVEQLRAGEVPDDLVRPRDLSAVTRASLREAFRAVAAVQRRIAGELEQGVR